MKKETNFLQVLVFCIGSIVQKFSAIKNLHISKRSNVIFGLNICYQNRTN